jgi:hypothetical protein
MVASLEAILASTVSTNHTYCHEFKATLWSPTVPPLRLMMPLGRSRPRDVSTHGFDCSRGIRMI